ncbi:hypothetical protein O0L34_g2460 [Tuta absoluta]|nr:hypothetical protein O0L34_g2460 [Tuta absoluta]
MWNYQALSFEKDRKVTSLLVEKRRLRPVGGDKLALSSSGGAAGVVFAPVHAGRRTREEGVGRSLCSVARHARSARTGSLTRAQGWQRDAQPLLALRIHLQTTVIH